MSRAGKVIHVHDGGAAMTFVEIARAMGYRDPEGIGRTAVRMVYCNAIRKLKARPEVLERLQQLAAAKSELRRSMTGGLSEGDFHAD